MNLTTTVSIDSLPVYAHIGVSGQERICGAWFDVSVSLTYDASHAMQYDTLQSSINYADIVKVIRIEMAKPMNLIEHAAFRIIRSLKKFPVEIYHGRVTIVKRRPPIPNCNSSASFTAEW